VHSVENLDGHGHGAKLETTVMMPSWCLTFMNWTSGLDFKLEALRYRHMNSFISITRDRDTGRVYPDPQSGLPRIEYTPSAFDRAHGLEGLLALARIAYTMNAEDISVSITNAPTFICNPPGITETKSEQSKRFEAWLEEIKKAGNAHPSGVFASAHQMGTCRMAKNESLGVVDMHGKVFGTEGLYVSDASVFPSASGVNPMITNMAISDWISQQLSDDIKRAERVSRMARL
jgi:choline dehydrogenase-like flavoprotein